MCFSGGNNSPVGKRFISAIPARANPVFCQVVPNNVLRGVIAVATVCHHLSTIDKVDGAFERRLIKPDADRHVLTLV
eukprot:COSAG05_NODE_1566_length_4539_cov_2.142342_1_plen_76_part_10